MEEGEDEEEEEEEEDKSFYGMRKAMWTIPTRSPRYLEIRSQNQDAILNATNK